MLQNFIAPDIPSGQGEDTTRYATWDKKSPNDIVFRSIIEGLNQLGEAVMTATESPLTDKDFFNLPREEQKEILMAGYGSQFSDPKKQEAYKKLRGFFSFMSPQVAVSDYLARLFDPEEDTTIYDAVDAGLNALPFIGAALDVPLDWVKGILRSSEYVEHVPPGTLSHTTRAVIPSDSFVMNMSKLIEKDEVPIAEIIPKLKELPVPTDVTVKTDPYLPGAASYNPTNRLITLQPNRPPLDVEKSLIHEYNHYIQHEADLPSGSSPSIELKRLRQYPEYKEVAEDLLLHVKEGAFRAGHPRYSDFRLRQEFSSAFYSLSSDEERALADLLYFRNEGEIMAYRTSHALYKSAEDLKRTGLKIQRWEEVDHAALLYDQLLPNELTPMYLLEP